MLFPRFASLRFALGRSSDLSLSAIGEIRSEDGLSRVKEEMILAAGSWR